MTDQNSLFNDFAEPQKQRSDANAASDEAVIAQVYDITRAIPPGRVMSYGAVGARCQPPISGYICGRIMIHSHESVPWWRIVGKDGTLPVSKRKPLLASDQRAKLEAEGVEFDENGRVKAENFEL